MRLDEWWDGTRVWVGPRRVRVEGEKEGERQERFPGSTVTLSLYTPCIRDGCPSRVRRPCARGTPSFGERPRTAVVVIPRPLSPPVTPCLLRLGLSKGTPESSLTRQVTHPMRVSPDSRPRQSSVPPHSSSRDHEGDTTLRTNGHGSSLWRRPHEFGGVLPTHQPVGPPDGAPVYPRPRVGYLLPATGRTTRSPKPYMMEHVSTWTHVPGGRAIKQLLFRPEN